MKNVRLSEFEIYLIKESLVHFKEALAKEEFPENAIITKQYFQVMIAQLEQKLSEKMEIKHAAGI